jgi:hypothetical protein
MSDGQPTDFYKKLNAEFNEIYELEQAEKLVETSHEQVVKEARKYIAKAKKEQRAERTRVYSQVQYV